MKTDNLHDISLKSINILKYEPTLLVNTLLYLNEHK